MAINSTTNIFTNATAQKLYLAGTDNVTTNPAFDTQLKYTSIYLAEQITASTGAFAILSVYLPLERFSTTHCV